MKRYWIVVSALLAVLSLSVAVAADTYTVDPRHTFPSYEVSHFGWSTQRGRFESVTGAITLDREARTGTVEISIDVASVSTGEPKLDQHLKHEDFFHAAMYPTVTFKSTRMHFEGDTPVAVDGELTMRGVTRPVTLTITSFHCAPNPYRKKDACGADAVATVKRSDFGMIYALPGLGDEVKLLINVEAFKN